MPGVPHMRTVPSWPPPRPRPPKASSLKQSARGEGGFPGGVGRPDGIQRASLVAQLVKNLPAMQETWVRFLGGEDPLEKEVATHSSLLAWRMPWTEEPGGLQSMGSQRIRHD